MEVYSNNRAANQHCLIELNEQDLQRHKKNIIFSSHPYKKNNKYYYRDIKYGTNIVNQGSKLMNNNKDETNLKLHLDQIKKNIVMICCSCIDCINLFPDLQIIHTNELYGSNKKILVG